MNKLSKFILIPAIALTLTLLVMPQALGCYGPHITAEISATQVNINEIVTITGRICPAEQNKTIRVTFTRPDYSWIDNWVLTDNLTGEFTVTQQLDMAGYWNIFPINGHICDRLFANVTDPSNPNAVENIIQPDLPPNKINYSVLTLAAISAGVAILAITVGTRKKTRNLSSFRLFIQILLLYLIFVGIFIDHQNLPWPAEAIAPHEVLLGLNEAGDAMPDGFPLPILACYYPCGRTVTCPLWQLQTYVYPFWDAGRGWGVNYDTTGITRIAIVVGLVVLGAVLLGRFWCGWVCPFGLYMDLVTRLRRALKIKHRNLSQRVNAKFHQLGYVILALLIILSVLFASELIAGTQLVPGTEQGGFIYQYFSAPFCQVCPMKPLCILTEGTAGIIRFEWILGPTTGEFYQLGFYLTSLNLLIFGIVTAAAFFYRRSWCRICPLGAMIGLFNRFPPFKWISGVRLHKVEEKCTKCGICKRVCPTQVTEVYEFKGGDVTTPNCILCLRCVEMCPEEGCLNFKVAGKTAFKSRNWLETNVFWKRGKDE